MGKSIGKKWTREDTINVLSLYVQLPFGKMHQNNPSVIELAKILNRTKGSVAYKLVNFASLDPYHQSRGVKGLTGATNLDRQVWEEYYGQWDALADTAVSSDSEEDHSVIPAIETDTVSIVKTRRGQAFFRRAVLSAYDGQCCVTGITQPSLLRASHIVPWSIKKKKQTRPA